MRTVSIPYNVASALKLRMIAMHAYLYHSTNKAGRDSILKNGLETNYEGFIYLAEKPIRKRNMEYVFKVKIPSQSDLMDWREAFDDGDDSEREYDPKNPYYLYLSPIPKKFIREVT